MVSRRKKLPFASIREPSASSLSSKRKKYWKQVRPLTWLTHFTIFLSRILGPEATVLLLAWTLVWQIYNLEALLWQELPVRLLVLYQRTPALIVCFNWYPTKTGHLSLRKKRRTLSSAEFFYDRAGSRAVMRHIWLIILLISHHNLWKLRTKSTFFWSTPTQLAINCSFSEGLKGSV